MDNKKLMDVGPALQILFSRRGQTMEEAEALTTITNRIAELEELLKTTHTHIAKYLPQDNVNYEILTTIEKALNKKGES